MASVVAKSFESPDEVRSPDKTKVEVVDLAGIKAARLTAQPGWKWSECIDVIEPGHDAWVVGDEPATAFEFDSSTAQTVGKPS